MFIVGGFKRKFTLRLRPDDMVSTLEADYDLTGSAQNHIKSLGGTANTERSSQAPYRQSDTTRKRVA
jgi:hypothetical protein